MNLSDVAEHNRAARMGPALALAIYSALSFFYFGPKTASLSHVYHGVGLDPTIHMWAMSWWPFALGHRLNPLITPAIWAPAGYNLARAVSIPAPSIVIYPVTRAFGPVVAYNLLCIVCPAVAAFSAFILCRHICHGTWPALVGGYIFGFSQYVLSQIGGHLFLLFIFPVPLVIYIVLLRLDGSLRRDSFLVLFVLLILFEFLSSTELFATTTLFGAMALALSFLIFAGLRHRLKIIIKEIALGYAALLVIVSPYLYYVLAGGIPAVANPAEAYSNDLLAFAVPTVVTVGGNRFVPISAQFKMSWGEMAAYLGPGVWLIMALFGLAYWRSKSGRLLFLSFGLIALASLGPKLHIRGVPDARLPWAIVEKLPLIDLALPGRFGMYLFLIAAFIVAIYLSRAGIPVWSKALLGISAVAFIAPNPAFTRILATKVNTPPFFRTGEYKKYISKGANILVLPNDARSQTLLWQAETNFYFRIATGFYIPPEEYPRWPVTYSFITSSKIPDFSDQLKAFIGAHQVKAIIVAGIGSGAWPSMLAGAGLSPISVGGVLLYTVPDQVLVSFANTTAHQMAEKQAAASFNALLLAACRYVDSGFPLAKLAPGEVQRLKLLDLQRGEIPPVGASSWWQNLWLGSWGGLVGVGIFGNYQDLTFLVQNYGPEAADIFFPFPKRLRKRPKQTDGQLLISFTPDGLRRAANKIVVEDAGSRETASDCDLDKDNQRADPR